jgi:hypothetical protein
VGFATPAFFLFSLSKTRRQEILRALALLFLAFSIEILQHLIYRNAMEWADIRDDSVAILAGFAFYYLANRRSGPNPIT